VEGVLRLQIDDTVLTVISTEANISSLIKGI